MSFDCGDETSLSEDGRQPVPAAGPSQRYRLVEKPSVRVKKRVRICDKRTSKKRPRSMSASPSSADKDEDDVSDRDPDVIKMIQRFRIDDEQALTAFYDEAFEQIQQTALKVILKAWIKVIQPKKQTDFPYISSNPEARKGRKAKGKIYDEPRVPPWWPTDKGVRHKEPDHISKEGRAFVPTQHSFAGRG